MWTLSKYKHLGKKSQKVAKNHQKKKSNPEHPV